ncbi:MAG TPA: MFS transporter [Dehalococcoidia bacterium]|nr:MFS transporter [Dehalococcoidia bacterium]HIK89431.1 MFS transporter [Dehalococcoidia bacterium]
MSNRIGNTNDEINDLSRWSAFKRALPNPRSRSRNLSNLSLYAFGLSGVWTGVGVGILPFKVLEALDAGRVEILGYALDKNGALGILSLLGLMVAAVAQLGAGLLSDRDSRLGSRLPYLLVGAFGLAAITVLFGFATSFVALMLAMMAMQMFGNIGQGPANALIIDHVHPTKRGQAAGVLNLWQLLGAGAVTVIVLQFMARYDAVEAPQWLWFSIALMITVLVLSTLWTVLVVRPSSGLFIPNIRRTDSTAKKQDSPATKAVKPRISGSYVAFLVALAFAIAAMSSMQIYALFFLQDVVGLENPAAGADRLVIVIVLAAALTVLPAGYLADRLGRASLFVLAGATGVISSLLLLFVDSIGPVLAIGAIVGISVGLFMTLTWAVANDLVSRGSAARELGYTSFATLGGAALARFAGIGIDELNHVSENLGYKAIIISVAIAFALSAVILAKIGGKPGVVEKPSDFEQVATAPAPD